MKPKKIEKKVVSIGFDFLIFNSLIQKSKTSTTVLAFWILGIRSMPRRNWRSATMTSLRWRTTTPPCASRYSPSRSATSSATSVTRTLTAFASVWLLLSSRRTWHDTRRFWKSLSRMWTTLTIKWKTTCPRYVLFEEIQLGIWVSTRQNR